MNKKFSTLLAGVALLSAMSANAQTTPAQNVLPTANGAYSIGKLVEGANSGLFQLKDEASGKVLSMDEDGVIGCVFLYFHWLSKHALVCYCFFRESGSSS